MEKFIEKARIAKLDKSTKLFHYKSTVRIIERNIINFQKKLRQK